MHRRKTISLHLANVIAILQLFPAGASECSYYAKEGNCLQVMKIMRNHANGKSDWLHSGHQSVNPSREVISIPWETQKIYVCPL